MAITNVNCQIDAIYIITIDSPRKAIPSYRAAVASNTCRIYRMKNIVHSFSPAYLLFRHTFGITLEKSRLYTWVYILTR